MPLPGFLKKMTKVTEKGYKMQSKISYPYTTTKGDATIVILKRDGTSKKFTILAEIQNFGIAFVDEGFRNRTIFSIATTKEDFGVNSNQTFGELTAIATHVAIVPNGEVYSIRDGGELQVYFIDMQYRIYGEKKGDKFIKAENE